MNWRYLIKTAYKDARSQWGKLFMFIASIILGISALVAINSFNENIVKDLDGQAASLAGADLIISGNRDLIYDLHKKLDSIPGENSKEIELFSMAYFPKIDESQFVQIKALEGNFPYYGKLLTEPPQASQSFRTKSMAVVADGFMVQKNLVIGDSIKLGTKTFPIGGRLKSNFGSIGLASGFAPTVYIALSELEQTDLIQPGSMMDYSYYYKTADGFDSNDWREENRSIFSAESQRIQTIESQKQNLREAFNSLNAFLNLVALVSLLLGCIGVASSVFIYIKNKIPTISVFRCLGLTGTQAFLIYFIQIFGLGFIGSLVGVALGSLVQLTLPIIFNDFLPIEVSTQLSSKSMWQGMGFGLTISLLFALVPLLDVRKISPLRSIRSSFEEDIGGSFDLLKGAVYFVIIAVLFLFLLMLTESWEMATIFTVGVLFSFGILYFVSTVIVWAIRKFFPRKTGFIFRQGLSNLYRPNNQTKILLISLGLGTAILSTLFIVQGLILKNVETMDAGNQPNVILYGIESNQVQEVSKLTENYELPIIESVPIVTMRIAGWQGRKKAEWIADTTRQAERWAFNREIRVTYRDTLSSSEQLLEGDFVGQYNPGDSIFISMDQGYAENLHVDIGDEVEFNVQGTLMKTYISSFRKIEFTNMRTRFFILFPKGVLEQAPQFQVLVTKSPNTTRTGQFRNAIVKEFPNVSVVDLSSILVTLNDILSKISYVLKFMAAFSILTGLIVLFSSLLLSKFQRLKESVILRTLGAKRNQILMINAVEYLVIGTLSALTGILISLIASYLVVKFQLDLDYIIQWRPIILIFIFIVGITVFIGLVNTRDVVNKSPLEVLRREV